MLKFLRKYQIVLLAIGGSLLMVVFLLQPILQQVAPNPANKKVAELGANSEKVTRGDRDLARMEAQALGEFLPWLPQALGLDAVHPGDHWLLLTHKAEQAGLIGEAGDGRSWIPDLAGQQLAIELQTLQQRGQFPTPAEQQELGQRIQELLETARARVPARYRMPVEVFDKTLAKARGVLRLQTLYLGAARLSDRRLMAQAQERGAAALADALVLTPELIAPTLNDPTESEQLEHLDRYGSVRPGDTDDNSFGIGYLQPPRLQIEWLALDPAVFESVATVDRVELRKRWQSQSPDGTDEEFRAVRAQLEAEMRAEQAEVLMAEADQIVRGELLRQIRDLESDGPYKLVPNDSSASGPDYEAIAALVVEQLRDRRDVRIPTPEVVRRNDAWLTASDIAALPGVGRAVFRVGAQQVPVFQLSQHVREVQESDTLRAQIGVPLVDPYATDAQGANYYITVLAARGESPPDALDDVRAQVIRNMRTVAAYERLLALSQPARDLAVGEGLQAAADFIADQSGLTDDAARAPTLARDLVVFRAGVQATLPGQRAPQQLQSETFTDAVIEAALPLDPLAQPDLNDADAGTIVIPLEQQATVAIARVRALRPLTAEAYRVGGESLVVQIGQDEVRDIVGWPTGSPFTLDALIESLKYTYDFDAVNEPA
jgi:hypothetical protein